MVGVAVYCSSPTGTSMHVFTYYTYTHTQSFQIIRDTLLVYQYITHLSSIKGDGYTSIYIYMYL